MVLKAQLVSRHWRGFRIGADGKRTESFEVNGSAVVGRHPVVEPGVRHNYSSATHGAYGECLEGWFMFVPGTMQEPTGKAFRVDCPTVTWTATGFIY